MSDRWAEGRVELRPGDCLDVMRRMAADGVVVQAIVTDPPYHLTSIVQRFGAPDAAPAKSNGPTGAYARASKGFMGKTWDGGDVAFQIDTWRLALALLPPGGHLVAFGGTRTYHRMACAIEDAGFEIRDGLLELIATDASVAAFLASLTAEQTAAFARCIEDSQFGGLLAWLYGTGFPKSHNLKGEWEGWGTALKPAVEPIILARKPLGGTVVEAVLAHGTGALNIDGCRIEGPDQPITFNERFAGQRDRENYRTGTASGQTLSGKGRHPANVLHDGSEEVLSCFPNAPGQLAAAATGVDRRKNQHVYGVMARGSNGAAPRGDSGSAARFFYSAKAGPDDRVESKHPTVKPVALLRWLVRLVTPPGGTVLDPFAGTGTAAVACLRESLRCILIEREAEYQADIRRRLDRFTGQDSPLMAPVAFMRRPR